MLYVGIKCASFTIYLFIYIKLLAIKQQFKEGFETIKWGEYYKKDKVIKFLHDDNFLKLLAD